MSGKKTQAVSGGTGFCGLLTIAFIVLKLLGVIAWSWWWVLGPLWIPAAIGVACIIAAFGVVIFIAVVSVIFSTKKGKK